MLSRNIPDAGVSYCQPRAAGGKALPSEVVQQIVANGIHKGNTGLITVLALAMAATLGTAFLILAGQFEHGDQGTPEVFAAMAKAGVPSRRPERWARVRIPM